MLVLEIDAIRFNRVGLYPVRISANQQELSCRFFTLVSTLNDGVGMDIGWYFYLFIEV